MCLNTKLFLQFIDFSVDLVYVSWFICFDPGNEQVFGCMSGFYKFLNMALIPIFFHDERPQSIGQHFGLPFE